MRVCKRKDCFLLCVHVCETVSPCMCVCAYVMNRQDCGVERQCIVGTRRFDCSFAPISLPSSLPPTPHPSDLSPSLSFSPSLL